MKFLILSFVVSLIFSTIIFAQTSELNIIPQPKSVKRLQGEFEFNYKTKIVAFDAEGRKSAAIFNDLLMKNYGFKLEYTEKEQKKGNVIVFGKQGFPVGVASPESYGITINPKAVVIIGSAIGQFYAVQTLMQMLPVDFRGATKLPAVDISDEPRFKYRGMHLDVARHFMPVSFVKKYIDLMSQYKFNNFHWHLTEDQGWRIEIKKYPKLAEISSQRKESTKDRNVQPYIGDGIPHGGFYTQEEVKEVVAYAKARFINIIPEIELPGHSVAALAAYPQLGCKENATYQVHTNWGITTDIYCPKEETFKFLEDVLSEVIDLFPDSPYIHIGGDEAPKDVWKTSPFVQDLMKREGLKDEHEVQSYFIRRIEKFINSKGKRIIGWDEILEGGLAPNATVMSWRGEKGGIEAAKANHDVIMTPTDFLYFDYGQGDPKYEPINIGNQVSLEKVYSYNPVPKELTAEQAKYILGAQANIWTEYLKMPENVEYMAFPRMLALAEVVWSPNESKNFADFSRRLTSQFARLDKQNVNYRIPAPGGLQNIVITDTDKAKIELTAPMPNSKIFYTLDGSDPSEKSTEYKKPFDVSLNQNEKKELKTIVLAANNRKSIIYAATLLRRSYIEAVELKDKTDGVKFNFYKNSFNSTSEMDNAAPTETGTTKSVQLGQFAKKTDLKQPFGVSFDGFINVPNDGIYEFQLESDDGSILMIDNEIVVNNDGAHSFTTVAGIVPLKKGFHRIRLKYFQGGGDFAFNFRWGIKGTGLRRITGNELFY